MGDNKDQIAFWSGEAGDRWAQAQVDLDRTIRPLGVLALDALDLRAGQRVLDVGCGCGDTTFAIAERIGRTGHVTGVDVSAPMLRRAHDRANERQDDAAHGRDLGAPTRFVEADAARAELPAVDRIFSRFGVMFFDDPVAAFTNLRRACQPGARLAFVCWRTLKENAWATVPLAGAVSVLGPAEGPPPDPTAPGPFAFADAARVRGILEQAGFHDVVIARHDVTIQWTTSDADEALRDTFARIGPAARRLADAPEDRRAAAIDAIIAAVRPHAGPDGVRFPAAVWIVSASA